MVRAHVNVPARARPRSTELRSPWRVGEHTGERAGERVVVAGGHQQGGVADDLRDAARRRWPPPATPAAMASTAVSPKPS